MRAFAEKRLAVQAKRLISKTKPFIVGVTGSVGKSSAKQAIGAVLDGTFRVRISPGNYNTEFGLPLTVLGLTSPKRSLYGWLSALYRGWARSMFPTKDYPDTLVLEMAADSPGDIAKLVDLAPPRIGGVTTVGESHLEFFESTAAIAAEKSTLIRSLPKDGVAILNRDDEQVWAMRKLTSAKVLSYGLHEEANVRALPDTISYDCHQPQNSCGTHFKLSHNGTVMPVFVSGALGRPAVYAALAAVAVGLARGLNLVEIVSCLGGFETAPGRLRYLPGLKGTILIDDSYNAAPKSVLAALEVLHEVPLNADDDCRFAVLGDMLELGSLSEQAHVEIGRRAAELDVDSLVLVGELMSVTERAAKEAGLSEDRGVHFSDADTAGRVVQERMKPGDAILVKGSRGMHMEYVVKELMDEPLRAADLLPGDHNEWRS